MQTVKVNVTTTGSDGSATGSGYSSQPCAGLLSAMYCDFGATAPGTTDVTITVEADDNHPAVTLYSKSNSATDAWVYPKVQSTDTAGAAITGEYQPIPVSGRIKVDVAGCNALDPALTVYLYIQ